MEKQKTMLSDNNALISATDCREWIIDSLTMNSSSALHRGRRIMEEAAKTIEILLQEIQDMTTVYGPEDFSNQHFKDTPF
jgi:hypothetical protein